MRRVIGLVALAHGLSHFFQLVIAPLFPLIKRRARRVPTRRSASWSRCSMRCRRCSSRSPALSSTASAGARCCSAASPAHARHAARRALVGQLRCAGCRRRARRHWQQRVPSGRLLDPQRARRRARAWPRLQRARRSRLARLCVGADFQRRRSARPSAGTSRCSPRPAWAWCCSCCSCANSGTLHIEAQPASDGRHLRRRCSRVVRLAGVAVLPLLHAVYAAGLAGLQSFGVSALIEQFKVAATAASSALTAYMVSAAAGILVGGFVAARSSAPRPGGRGRPRGQFRWRSC